MTTLPAVPLYPDHVSRYLSSLIGNSEHIVCSVLYSTVMAHQGDVTEAVSGLVRAWMASLPGMYYNISF